MATISPSSGRSVSQRASTAHKPLTPFTVDHFRQYARLMVLDSGESWEIEDFQLEIVSDIFAGHLEVWAVIPEANGKTTLMSGLSLYHGDYTEDAMACLAASSRDQAGWLFGQAAKFVNRSPGFDKRFKVFPGYREIRCVRSGGKIQVFAADDRTGDGVIFSLALLDELHRHRDLRLYRVWTGKLDKRGGQVVAISTAGEPGSEFELIREGLRQSPDATREGYHLRAESAGMVLHDWQVPIGEDVGDPEVVKQANPFSGITTKSLARKFESPTMSLAHWRRFVCNQPVRDQSSAISEIEWDEAGSDEQIPEGVPIWVGADPAWKIDTFAITPFWMPEKTKRFLGRPHILVPPEGGLKPSKVKAAFEQIAARNPIECVVMDTNFGAEIAEWLETELGARVVAHAQTDMPMARAYERFMEALRNGWLHHPRHSGLTRHALNAIAHVTRTGLTRFERPSQSRSTDQEHRVIDALIAAAMVNSIAASNEKPKRQPLDLSEYQVITA